MAVAENQFTMLADGIPGAEGPVLDAQGRLFCVAPREGRLLEIADDGTKRELANTGGTPAGLQITDDGRIWIADMKLGILRATPAGELEHTVSTYDGQPIRGCNDCALDSRGNLYFTAPAGSSMDQPVGELFCRLLDGTVVRLDTGYAFCNGLAVAADDATLVVAETPTKKLWAYDLPAPGRVANRRLFATLRGEHKGGPDGMDFDAGGALLATNHGGSAIEVFDATGQPEEVIELPFAHPSNVHFGGEDGRDLYITEHTNNAIWRTRWHRPGLLRFPPG